MDYLKNYKTTSTGIILIILGIIYSYKDAVMAATLITTGIGFIVSKDGDKQ